MKKTFTCRDLKGICDEEISGNSVMEIAQNGAKHMQSDEAHREHMKTLAKQYSAEDKKRWFDKFMKKNN